MRQRGQATVEFALVSVVFFLLVFGIVDGARLFQSWVTLQHAARSGARYAITGQQVCPAYPSGSNRVACTDYTAKKATKGIAGGDTGGGGVTVTYKKWLYTGGTWPDPAIANDLGVQCDQVEIKVSYTHKFMTPVIQGILPAGVGIVGSQRMTNEPFGPC